MLRKLKKERAARAARGEAARPANTKPTANDEDEDDEELDKPDEPRYNTLMMRLIGPVVSFVDRPWKMYPVGVLFGFGKCPSQSQFPYLSLLPDDARCR